VRLERVRERLRIMRLRVTGGVLKSALCEAAGKGGKKNRATYDRTRGRGATRRGARPALFCCFERTNSFLGTVVKGDEVVGGFRELLLLLL
jgi:hypothetical protein